MDIKKMFSKNRNHYTGNNPCNYITIHETSNWSKGANALMHANYINSGSEVTWHYTVDDKNIIQHYNDTVQCWHAGNDKGNFESIGIEICVNPESNFLIACNNAIDLTAFLMKKHNIPIDKVVQHNYWSGKNCPLQIRGGKHGITWNDFITKVKNKQGSTVKPVNNSNKLYRVQVGAFKKHDNALKLRNEIRNKGYKDAFITYVDSLHKVQVGAFSVKDNAITLSNKLKALGYSTYIKYD